MADIILHLSLQAALPVVLSAGFYLACAKTRFGKLDYKLRQAIIGVAFGIAAIISTESGTGSVIASANVRDAAPLCAGLIFGAPAGIIAGVIGGAERFLCVLWGGGEYTRLACSIATVLAGLIAAWVRKYMLVDRPPLWTYGLSIACFVESFHMLLVIATHMDDVHSAFEVVESCALLMILLNGVSVTLALVIVQALRRRDEGKSSRRPPVAETVQQRLLLCVAGGFMLTAAFTFAVHSGLTESEIYNILSINITDVENSIAESSDSHMQKLVKWVAEDLELYGAPDSDEIEFLAEDYEFSEVSYVDGGGIVRYSTNEKLIGYDMSEGEQSAEFLTLLSSGGTYVQDFRAASWDESVMMKYAGAALSDGGFIQVGYDKEQMKKELAENIESAASNRHIKESGYIIVLDDSFTVVSDTHGYVGENVSETGITADISSITKGSVFKADAFGEQVRMMYGESEGYYILAVITETEAAFSQKLALYFTLFIEAIVFSLMFVQIYILIQRRVVGKISSVDASLAKITAGDLNVQINERDNCEFSDLSDGINHTVSALKGFIEREARRNEKDLALAKSIQHSALPSVFPPYPDKSEFEIYARMDTAKEVGGDFYDFYFTGDETFAFLIADVSGKGIPAALFMMRAKTVIKSLAQTGIDADEILTRSNQRLCENNEAEMFVTVWLGILNLKTGKVSFANAGHNPPLIRRKGGEFEYFKTRPGFVLGGMDGMKYRRGEFKLEPGDEIYLYTDGITEATDSNEELYGEKRLAALLNSLGESDSMGLCNAVKNDVDAFVGDAPQFDDMTMLSLKLKSYIGMKGNENVNELNVNATVDNIALVTAFVDAQLEKLDCPMKAQTQIDVAIDELFGNIAQYAYNPETGPATVRVEVKQDPLSVVITFIDNGVPYDPLAKQDPDITLSAEERGIGGLGIFLVKKTMDNLSYEYKDGQNILKIEKKL